MMRHSSKILAVALRLIHLASGGWTQLNPMPPTARDDHTAVWSPGANGFYLFAGWSGSGPTASRVNDLWLYSVEANRWSELSPSGGSPAARTAHAAAWLDTADGFYIFGGWSGSRFNDLWFYSRQANTWSELSPSGGPPAARDDCTAVGSDAADGFYIFGGFDDSFKNDLWFYSRQANTWSELTPTGGPPTVRRGHTTVWSDSADGFYLFGGYSPSGYFNDLWFYSRQDNTWSELSPSGTPPAARLNHAAAWAADDDGFYIFGGDDGSNLMNDIWFFNRQANAWYELSPGGTLPAVRTAHSGVYANTSLTLYFFGGSDGESRLSEFWSIQLSALTTATTTGTTTTSISSTSKSTSLTVTSSSVTASSTTLTMTSTSITMSSSSTTVTVSSSTTSSTSSTTTSSSATKTISSTSFTSTVSSSTTSSSTTAASQELAGSFLVDVADVQAEQLEAAAKAALLRMEEGIRDAVITLSIEGRGRRLQAIRRWKVSYILVVLAEEVEEALNLIENIGSANADFQAVLRTELVDRGVSASSADALAVVAVASVQATSAAVFWTEEVIVAVSVGGCVVAFVMVLCLIRQVRRYRTVKRVRKEAEMVFETENPKYRWAMVAARFDGGENERLTREVSRMLKEMGCNILIVDAKAGTDYGLLTMQYLNKIHEEKGVLLSVCSPHYGEKTASPYSSHQELIYALDNKLEVLPLKVDEIYPPKPPCGPKHRFDKASVAPGLISMIFKSSVVFVDCVGKTEAEIAIAVEERLRKQDYVEEAEEKAKQVALEEFKHENPEYRWAMISARFDGGEVEQTFREVVRIMKGHNCNILMVDAKGGDDFGLLTIQYLNKIRADNGVMVAVCTPNYGEKTASPYSSHQELIYALDNKLEVLPLKVNEIYPPEPPCGPNHRFDHASAAEGLISMMLPSTLPPKDCLGQSAEAIAEMLMNHLRQLEPIPQEVSKVTSLTELHLEEAIKP